MAHLCYCSRRGPQITHSIKSLNRVRVKDRAGTIDYMYTISSAGNLCAGLLWWHIWAILRWLCWQTSDWLTLGSPAEVAGVEPERAVLHVAATAAHRVDALAAELGVGGGATHLELPLFPELRTLSARFTALVPRVPGNTWRRFPGTAKVKRF